jgi:hypothetical protein
MSGNRSAKGSGDIRGPAGDTGQQAARSDYMDVLLARTWRRQRGIPEMGLGVCAWQRCPFASLPTCAQVRQTCPDMCTIASEAGHALMYCGMHGLPRSIVWVGGAGDGGGCVSSRDARMMMRSPYARRAMIRAPRDQGSAIPEMRRVGAAVARGVCALRDNPTHLRMTVWRGAVLSKVGMRPDEARGGRT